MMNTIIKLGLSMMLLLTSTLGGWSQSLEDWTVYKGNNDTIVDYNFTKDQLRNLRIYVTELERTEKLYIITLDEISVKDELINNLSDQIGNRESVISIKDSVITFQQSELKKSDEYGKKQEQLKMKYKKATGYSFIGGGVLGIILCLILGI